MNDLISRKWLMECVDEGWIKFDTEKDKNIYVHLVRDIAPSAQPATNCSEIPNGSDDTISRQAAIDCVTYDVEHTIECLKALPSAQPEQNGKWIYNSPTTMKCNRCGFVIKD